MVVVLGITVAGYHKVQPLPLQTLPLAQPHICLIPDVFFLCAEDSRSVSRDQGLADCAITSRQTWLHIYYNNHYYYYY